MSGVTLLLKWLLPFLLSKKSDTFIKNWEIWLGVTLIQVIRLFKWREYMWFQAYSGYEQIIKLGWNCKKYKCQNANYLITSQSNFNFKNANSYLRLGFCKISSTVTLTKAFLLYGYLRVCLSRSVKTPKTGQTSITDRRRWYIQSILAHLWSKLCHYPLTKLPNELSLTIFLLVKTLNIYVKCNEQTFFVCTEKCLIQHACLFWKCLLCSVINQ